MENTKFAKLCGSVLNGEVLRPFVDVMSHKEIYELLQWCRHKPEVISAKMVYELSCMLTESKSWEQLPDIAYALIMFTEDDEIPIRRIIASDSYGLFSECVSTALQFAQHKLSTIHYLKLVKYYQTLEFSSCFDECNDKTIKKIKMLEADRSNNYKIFLINPHQLPPSFFKYSPSADEHWSCKELSRVPKLPMNSPTLADYDVAKERFINITHGLLHNRLINTNENITFPFDKVVISGGSITKIIAHDFDIKNARQSDIDIFIIGDSIAEKSKTLRQIVNWFASPRTYYAVNSSVMSVYIKDIPRKFQIITTSDTNPFEIVNHFDLTHVQWMYYNDQFLGTAGAIFALRERFSRFTGRVYRLKTSRLIKTLYCGYDLEKSDQIMEDFIDITSLITNIKNEQLTKIIRGFHKYYYPVTDPELSSTDELLYILGQIEEDSKMPTVTDDPIVAVENVYVGGNFQKNYESNLYKTFNANQIKHDFARRVKKPFLLRSINGVIKLTSCKFIIDSIDDADGINIKVTVTDDEFIKFVNDLETNTFRMFSNNRGVTSHNIINGKMIFKFDARLIDYQNVNGRSILHSHRGEPLLVKEDLVAGDIVQFKFMLMVNIEHNSRTISLKPCRIIKHISVDDEVGNAELIDAVVQGTQKINYVETHIM